MAATSKDLHYVRNLKEAGTIKNAVDDAEMMEQAMRQKEMEISAIRDALARHIEKTHAAVAEIWTPEEIRAAKSEH